MTLPVIGKPLPCAEGCERRGDDFDCEECDEIEDDDCDEDYGDVTCSTCCGTGEGMHDGSSCRTCGGGGGQSIAARRAARAEYLADCDDGT